MKFIRCQPLLYCITQSWNNFSFYKYTFYTITQRSEPKTSLFVIELHSYFLIWYCRTSEKRFLTFAIFCNGILLFSDMDVKAFIKFAPPWYVVFRWVVELSITKKGQCWKLTSIIELIQYVLHHAATFKYNPILLVFNGASWHECCCYICQSTNHMQ